MKNRRMYVEGSAAYAPERLRENPLTKEEFEKLRKSKINSSNRQKLKKNLKKRKTMITIISLFILGFGVIFGEAQVYKTQKMLTDTNKKIDEITSNNDDLKLQLSKAANIVNVKTVAQTNLSMVAPDRSKTVYIDLQKDNFSEITEDGQANVSESVVTKIKKLLF